MSRGPLLPLLPCSLDDADRRKLDENRPVVASVSGGKDSTAMALWLLEQNIDFEPVFVDTGWEHPATYDYLRGPLASAIGEITWLRAKRQMAELILDKATFPSRRRRFCTTELKLRPMEQYLQKRYPNGDVINAVGIRAAESRARRDLPRWSCEDGVLSFVDTWRPLINWGEAAVRAFHQRHRLPLNPLYEMGASRVGCWPCIYARKAEIRLLADTDPQRVDHLRELEAAVSLAARKRGYSQPSTFFFSRSRGPTSIDAAVNWARGIGRGSYAANDELFDPGDGARGCMRWGLCEFADDGPSDDGEHLRDLDDEMAVEVLAYNHHLANDWAAARRAYTRALATHSAPAVIAVAEANLAEVLLALELPDEASQHFDVACTAATRFPSSPRKVLLTNQLAWGLLRSAEGREPLQRDRALEQALELAMTARTNAGRWHDVVADTIIRIQLAMGRTEQAELEARRVLQRNPDCAHLQDVFLRFELIEAAPVDPPPPHPDPLGPLDY